MKPPLDRRVALTLAVILIAAIVLALYVDKGTILLSVNEHEVWSVARFFHTVTDFGDHLAYVIAIAVALLVKFRYAVAIACNGLVTLFLSGYLKSLFQQPRPLVWLREQGLDGAELFAFGTFLQPAYDSFPSGHAMAAFSLYGFCALVSKRAWQQAVWLCLAVLIAFSRIYLGFHFLQDIVFGSIVGMLIAYTGYILQSRYLTRVKILDVQLYKKVL